MPLVHMSGQVVPPDEAFGEASIRGQQGESSDWKIETHGYLVPTFPPPPSPAPPELLPHVLNLY